RGAERRARLRALEFLRRTRHLGRHPTRRLRRNVLPGVHSMNPQTIHSQAITPVNRERIELRRVDGDTGVAKKTETAVLWFEALTTLAAEVAPSLDLIVEVKDAAAFAQLTPRLEARVVVASADVEALATARAAGHKTCFWAYVDGAASLHAAIETGSRHAFVM